MDDRREIEERVRGERNLRKMRVERKALKKDVIWNGNRLGIDFKKNRQSILASSASHLSQNPF